MRYAERSGEWKGSKSSSGECQLLRPALRYDRAAFVGARGNLVPLLVIECPEVELG
jgi:hypothetical protein